MYAAWDLTVLGLKHDPPALMALQSNPPSVQAQLMFACNEASEAPDFGTHHCFLDVGVGVTGVGATLPRPPGCFITQTTE